MLFWSGPVGKACFGCNSVDETAAKISTFNEFIVIGLGKDIFLLSSKSFQLLDKRGLEAEIVDIQGQNIQLASQNIVELSFEAGKIQLFPSTKETIEPDTLPEAQIVSSGESIKLLCNNSKQIVSEISGKARASARLDKYTVIGSWLEEGKLFVSPFKLLSECSDSNSSSVPFILWSSKQLFVHRAALYPRWLHLERSEQFDVIDSQIGEIKTVSASEDCLSLAVLNEAGLVAVCDFKRRLWRPVRASCSIEEIRFLKSDFLIFKSQDDGKLYLIALSQPELYATAIPLQAPLDFYACSSDGSLIVQATGGVHVFSFTFLPSNRQIHFTNSFSCRFEEGLVQAAVHGGLLYLLAEDCKLSIIAMNTGDLTAQLKNISCFLCFDGFVLVKQGTWHLYWNSRLFNLDSSARSIYPQIPGIVAIGADLTSFSLSTPVDRQFLLPALFRLTGQLRLLERCAQDELVLEYLLLECRDEPELLRQVNEFFATGDQSVILAQAIIKCCRKIELAEAIKMFAHLPAFSPLKIVEMTSAEDCFLFLPFLANSFDEECKEAIKKLLPKLSDAARVEAKEFLAAREIAL